MSAAIVPLLLTLPFAASAETPQGEQSSVSRLRTCVRSHARDAQAAGVRTPDDAASYFVKVCLPLFGMFLESNNTAKEEALPPGIYRNVIRQEWSGFVDQGDSR